jgi:hypothetical protein
VAEHDPAERLPPTPLYPQMPVLGVNGRQRLFCTLQGGDLSADHVRQMVNAAPRLREISLSLPGQQRLSNDPYQ